MRRSKEIAGPIDQVRVRTDRRHAKRQSSRGSLYRNRLSPKLELAKIDQISVRVEQDILSSFLADRHMVGENCSSKGCSISCQRWERPRSTKGHNHSSRMWGRRIQYYRLRISARGGTRGRTKDARTLRRMLAGPLAFYPGCPDCKVQYATIVDRVRLNYSI